MTRILEKCFPNVAVEPPRLPAPVCRLTTAALLGGADGFILSADACLAEIAAYVATDEAAG
ncbi:MAG TPA: hypothetical protein VIJ35_11385 [Bradyrhizobium sp.]